MTTPTKERVAQIASECGFGDGLLTWPTVDEKLYAFAIKVLAESEDRWDAEKPKTRNYWRKQYELLGRVMWPNYEAAKKYDTGYIRWNVASIDAAI